MLIRSVVALTVLLSLPGSVMAQAGTPGPEPRVSATGGVALKASQISEEYRLHFGGWAGLFFTDNLAIGGGGYALLNDIELAGGEGDTGNHLSMSYGGVVFRYWEPINRSITGQVGLLLGGGHAEVQTQLAGVEVGSDNFLVTEGEIGAAYSLARDAHVAVSLGYRLTASVQDLPRVTASDLSGFTGTLSLRIGG